MEKALNAAPSFKRQFIVAERLGLRRLNFDYPLLALLALIAAFPLLLNPGLPGTADGLLHLHRIAELDQALRDGPMYPRVAPDLAFGYGYPVFNYYAPLFYWLGLGFHRLGLSLEWAEKATVIVALYLYPLGMYLLARRLVSRRAALVAATAYLFAPYRFHEIFVAGTYPQFLALSIVPFCLWAVTPNLSASCRKDPAVSARPHLNFLAFVFCYGALLLAHNLTAMIATPLIGAYIVFVLLAGGARGNGGQTERVPTLRSLILIGHGALRIALAILLSLALTAFFWLPSIGEQGYVRTERLTAGFFDFRQYFLSVAELLSPNVPPDLAGVNPYFPFNVGPVILWLATLGLLAGASVHLKGNARYPVSFQLFFALGALTMAVLTLPVSLPLWDSIPLLAFVEFPRRFVGLATLPLAMLAGFAFQAIELVFSRSKPTDSAERESSAPLKHAANRWGVEPVRHWPLAAALGMGLLILDVLVYLFPRTPFVLYGDPSLRDLVQYETTRRVVGTTSAGEYLPIWGDLSLSSSPLESELLANRVPNYLDRAALPPAAHVQVIQQTTTSNLYQTRSDLPFTLHVRRIYFPGWRITIDGRAVPLDLAAPHGTMQVAVPAGEHVVQFQFGETPLRQVADGLSLVALLIVIGITIRYGWQLSMRRGLVRSLAHPNTVCIDTDRQGRSDSIGLPGFVVVGALAIFYLAVPREVVQRSSPLPKVIGAQYPRVESLGDQMRLLAYDLSVSTLTAGNELALTLYWQPIRAVSIDYAPFVHLDHPITLQTVAQADRQHPGDIPISQLPPSLYVRDSHTLRVPPATEPGLYLLQVGLWDRQTQQVLPVPTADGARRNAVALQSVRVRRAAPVDLRDVTRTQVQFDEIELIGYRLDRRQLTLYWRARQPILRNATVFIHLLDASGQLIDTFDGPPTGGLLPTSAWEQYEIVVDRHPVDFERAGGRRVGIGIYDPQTLERYPALGPDGRRLPNDGFILEQE